MAEEKLPPPIRSSVSPLPPPSVNVMLPAQQAPAAYANGWLVQIGEAEITLTFGVGVGTAEGASLGLNPVIAITLAHSRFVKLEAELQQVSLVLQKLYDGPIPAIQGLSKAKIDAAVAEVRGEIEKR